MDQLHVFLILSPTAPESGLDAVLRTFPYCFEQVPLSHHGRMIREKPEHPSLLSDAVHLPSKIALLCCLLVGIHCHRVGNVVLPRPLAVSMLCSGASRNPELAKCRSVEKSTC